MDDSNGQKLQIFDARKRAFRRYADVVGKVGEVSNVTDKSFCITAQGGMIEVLRARGADGKKLGAGDFARSNGLADGIVVGTEHAFSSRRICQIEHIHFEPST